MGGRVWYNFIFTSLYKILKSTGHSWGFFDSTAHIVTLHTLQYIFRLLLYENRVCMEYGVSFKYLAHACNSMSRSNSCSYLSTESSAIVVCWTAARIFLFHSWLVPYSYSQRDDETPPMQSFFFLPNRNRIGRTSDGSSKNETNNKSHTMGDSTIHLCQPTQNEKNSQIRICFQLNLIDSSASIRTNVNSSYWYRTIVNNQWQLLNKKAYLLSPSSTIFGQPNRKRTACQWPWGMSWSAPHDAIWYSRGHSWKFIETQKTWTNHWVPIHTAHMWQWTFLICTASMPITISSDHRWL